MTDRIDDTIKICHFSDLHLPLKKMPMPWDLVGKRALGFANLKLNRGKTYQKEAFISLLDHIVEQSADLLVVTGDLSSLSFSDEFEAISRLFQSRNIDPEKIVLIPGNHDRYTPTAVWSSAFEKGLSRWMPEDIDYPRLKMVGPVAVIALDTSVWRNPFSAAGRISSKQIDKLKKILNREELQNKWPVIVMHHPPFHLRKSGMRDFLTGLQGVDRLIDALGDHHATLLHGHIHRFSRRKIENLDVIGVPSASNNSGNDLTQLTYHTYYFDQEGLKEAYATRHWPEEIEPDKRFERFKLPEERFAD